MGPEESDEPAFRQQGFTKTDAAVKEHDPCPRIAVRHNIRLRTMLDRLPDNHNAPFTRRQLTTDTRRHYPPLHLVSPPFYARVFGVHYAVGP